MWDGVCVCVYVGVWTDIHILGWRFGGGRGWGKEEEDRGMGVCVGGESKRMSKKIDVGEKEKQNEAKEKKQEKMSQCETQTKFQRPSNIKASTHPDTTSRPCPITTQPLCPYIYLAHIYIQVNIHGI